MEKYNINTSLAVKSLKTVGIGIAGLILLNSTFYKVDSGESAIVLRFGSVNSIQGEGLHMKAPFMDEIIKVDMRSQKTAQERTQAGTKDQQVVYTSVSSNYHLGSDKLGFMYSKVGLNDLDNKIIEPRIQESLKAITAQYSSEQLLLKREIIREQIRVLLKGKLAPYNIVLEDIQMTNFEYDPKYRQAIEDKQIAEQNALKAKNDLERIKVESDAKIVQARAQAEAIRIQAEAIKATGGDSYLQMKWIEKWDGKMPQVTGTNNQMLMQMPK